MKHLVYFLFFSILILSCSKDDNAFVSNDAVKVETRVPQPKVDVCHYDTDNDSWHVININQNALQAHLIHGDVLLEDADGDGWVENDNECVPGGDCNDGDASVNPRAMEVCDDGIDNDCDELVDCDDTDCEEDEVCASACCWSDLIQDSGNIVHVHISSDIIYIIYNDG